jgi:hypothetical protein
MIIVGAGLAGLTAAHAWPQAMVLEANPEPLQLHQALLRFRTDAVARLTGIEFREVTVRKGIYFDGEFRSPSIALANFYSLKCLDALVGERSIWNLDAAKRYIAPETLYEQLVESVGSRLHWSSPFDFDRPAVSTAPLDATCSALNVNTNGVQFKRAPILVQRFRVPHADVFQTVYFPTLDHSMYRASITGSLLIVEHAYAEPHGEWEEDLRQAFGIFNTVPVGSIKQTFGKIAPVDDVVRKRLLFDLTHKHGVFSLGRFATWRNILLDDVVDDIAVIKRLMRTAHDYDVRKAMQ